MSTTPFLLIFCIFVLNFVIGQWFGGDRGMGGMDMGGGGGMGRMMMGGGGGGGGGGGEGGMGNEELNALELLKTVMERRAQSNQRLREQLDRTNRELRGANDELKTTRDRIEELGTRCEQFGRIKDVLREKIAEIEDIFANSEQGGGGEGGGGQGGGGRGQYMATYGGRGGGGGGGGGMQEIWSSGDESLTIPGMRRARRDSVGGKGKRDPPNVHADIALCELEPNLQHKLERELDSTQQRISRLKSMERKISVSLFLARLF